MQPRGASAIKKRQTSPPKNYIARKGKDQSLLKYTHHPTKYEHFSYWLDRFRIILRYKRFKTHPPKWLKGLTVPGAGQALVACKTRVTLENELVVCKKVGQTSQPQHSCYLGQIICGGGGGPVVGCSAAFLVMTSRCVATIPPPVVTTKNLSYLLTLLMFTPDETHWVKQAPTS